MNNQKKIGRPKQKEHKDNIVSTYLTNEEYKKFKTLIKQSGLSISAYIRLLILGKIQ